MNKWLVLIGLAALLAFAAGCSDDDCPSCPPDNTAPSLTYVGSSTCGTAGCHEDNYNEFIESGHPYKLTEVVNGTAPTYPWDDEHTSGGIVSRDGPPPGTPWTDYAYVIGGYGWKARWVKPDGRVYTATDEAQLNLWADGPEWVAYHLGEDKKYNYSCFKCHTTGASPEGSWPAGETGFGTFVFGGVQCEACHGEGSQHVSDPARFPMVVDRSADLCGKCHTRDPGNRVLVSGSTPETTWIRHHEQYDEMVHSPHAAIGCGACHDAHASTVYDDVAIGTGIIADCGDCHPDELANNAHNGAPSCTDCHMPQAAKSARVTDNPYVADIASHTFMINPNPVDRTAMWTSDDKFLAVDEFGRGRVTLDFACYSCHKDDPTNPTNPTAPFSDKTLQELSDKAMNIHAAPPPGMVSR